MRLFSTLAVMFFTLQEILRAVGRGLGPLNRANKIWCYGFGDVNTRDDSVFCFMPNDEPCKDLDQVSRIARCVPLVRACLFQRGSLCLRVFSRGTLEYVSWVCTVYQPPPFCRPAFSKYTVTLKALLQSSLRDQLGQIVVCTRRPHIAYLTLGSRTRSTEDFVRRWRTISR